VRLLWEQVLETSDLTTLHSPLTEDTRNMLAMPEFEAMKRKPLIVNTARGGLVNESDLVRAHDSGLISGARFDVQRQRRSLCRRAAHQSRDRGVLTSSRR
jgi:phosphoglycerate dehydrogenase-like enzyme